MALATSLVQGAIIIVLYTARLTRYNASMGQLTNTNEDGNAAGDRMLALIRTKFPQYHPILAIAEMAHDTSVDDDRIKLECHKTILKHVSPELKSMEVKAQITETRRVVVSMWDGDDEDSPAVIENPPQEQLLESAGVQEQLVDILAVSDELTG